MSSGLEFARRLCLGRAGRWSALRLLVSPARSREGLERLGGLHGGAELSSFGIGDWVAVAVAQNVGLVAAPAGRDAGDEDGSEGAEGAVVMLACRAKPLVASSDGRVGLAGVIGGEEQ